MRAVPRQLGIIVQTAGSEGRALTFHLPRPMEEPLREWSADRQADEHNEDDQWGERGRTG